MSITKDFLPNHPNISIYQDDEMFRINTDTQVLGEFLNIYRENVVLDMGTNNGALLIYASFFHPRKLIGIEINEKALELAKKNLDENMITDYKLCHADIITYRENAVDVVICNPPYFKTMVNNRGQNPYKVLAKHEGDLTLDKLITSIDYNLKEKGTLFFLFLTARLDEVFKVFDEHHLQIKELQFVYDNNKEYSNVVLIRAVKNGQLGLVVDKPIIIKR